MVAELVEAFLILTNKIFSSRVINLDFFRYICTLCTKIKPMKMKNLFRFCSLMLSWAVCANVLAQIQTPVVTSNPDACDAPVKFTISNYDPSLSYTWRVNSAVVSASGSSYIVSSPVEGTTYTAVVEATDGASNQSSTPVSQTYKKTPAKPTVNVNSFDCDAPVQFAIANYDASTNYSWTVDGVTTSSTTSTYTVSNPQDRQTYKATVVAEKNGCISAESAQVQRLYLTTPATPQITTTHDCGREIKYKLNTTYPTDYSQVWKVNNTTVTPIAGEYSLLNYSDSASYTLELAVSNSMSGQVCSSTASASVVAKVAPNSPEVSGYKACADAGTGSWDSLVKTSKASNTLSWYDDFSSTTPIVPPVNFDKNLVGSTSFWVTQTSAVGCESAKAEVKVTVDEVPVANAGDDVTICYGESVVLADGETADPNVKYTWTPSGKVMGRNDYPVTTIPLTSDTQFKLTAVNINATSCKSEDSVYVKVLSKPEVNLSQNSFTVCQNGSVTILNNNADPTKESYYWETITGGVSTCVGGDVSLTLTSLNESTTIKLTSILDDLPSCTTSKEANVTVIPIPVADPGQDRYVCAGNTVQIGTRGVTGVNYSWTPATGLNNQNIATPTVTNVTADQMYTLTASSNVVSGCTDTKSVWVYKVDKPQIYTLTGGGSYCDGAMQSGINIALSGSDGDTEYDLVRNGVAQDNWTPGLNGVLEWRDVTAGTYRVKARKIGFNTCEEFMTGTVSVNAVSSPSASVELYNSTVACPGDTVTVRVKITGGVAPYNFTLLTNGVPQNIAIPTGNIYDFSYILNTATTFEVSEVSDNVCSIVYNPTDYPTLPLNMADFDKFKLYASKANPVCYGDRITLKVDYNDSSAEYHWENGLGGNSQTISVTQDHTYQLLVVTPEGCRIPSEYKVDVVEKLPVTLGPELNRKSSNDEFLLCSTDANLFVTATPEGGRFTSTPTNLIVPGTNNEFKPSVVTNNTTKYTIKYEYTDPASGCVMDTTFKLTVSAVNKTVNWTLAPTNEKPSKWANVFEKCQPDPSDPRDVVMLQGEPKTPYGEWSIDKVEDSSGGPATNTGAYIVKTNSELSQAQMLDITAGITYWVSYTVRDIYGCDGVSLKPLTIKSNPTNYVYSGGLNVLLPDGTPTKDVCINETNVTLVSSQNPGTFKLADVDTLMYVRDTPDGKGIIIDPSKGKIGEHKVIFNIAHTGCSYNEEVLFNIVNPIDVICFNLSKKAFCESDTAEVITVTTPLKDSVQVATTGEIEIRDAAGAIVYPRRDINSSPIFNPSGKLGKYTIIYYYNDGTCDSEYSEEVEVFANPVIDFQMKDNYCYGERILVTPNYPGSITLNPITEQRLDSLGHPNKDEIIKGNIFYTETSGKGQFVIDYEAKDGNGCVSKASKEFYVRGVEGMSVQVDSYFCAPAGLHDVSGFPPIQNPQDSVYFTTHPVISLIDNADGTGKIDLVNSTYNSTYPLTYHYVQAYTDSAGNAQTCETTVTKNFTVLDQTADFSGYKNGATICSDVLKIELTAFLTENTKFSFSDSASYPTAFVDNGDGTAILYPSQLAEGYYRGVTMTHKYFDAAGNLICDSEITKSFRISKIEEVTDISLFCDTTENKTAVRLKNTELGIRYDLYVNNANYDSFATDSIGQKVEFKAIDVPTAAFASIYVMAVDTSATSCALKMSKEFTISPLHASVVTKNISCNGKLDGKFTGSYQGGVGAPNTINHKLINKDANTESPISSSVILGAANYDYVVTDSVGCNFTVPFKITEPNPLDFIIEQTDVDCFGNSTATLNAQVISEAGVGPYSYEWIKIDPVNGNQFIDSVAAVKVAGGLYKITVVDANGCLKDSTANVMAPLQELTVSLVNSVDVGIIGQATGEIDIYVEGGTPDITTLDPVTGYSYEWSGNGINDTNKHLEDLTGLVAGTYTVKVKDAKGCEEILSVVINEPSEIKVKQTIKNVSCFGLSDGIIRLDIYGGSPYNGSSPYNITWTDEAGNVLTPSVNNYELDGQPAGTYHYVVIDSDGNKVEDDAIIAENQPLTVTTSTLSKLKNTCNGYADGNIELDITGGTGTYRVTWQGVAASQLLNDGFKAINLPASIYNVLVEDSNGCKTPHAQEVTQPGPLVPSTAPVVVQNICRDGVQGSIDIDMQGGTPGYTYNWSGAGVDPIAEDQINLKAGVDYSVIVYDAEGCRWDSIFTMDNPQELTLTLNKKDIQCSGSRNGTLEAVVTGEMPFTYVWTDPAGANPFANIPKIDCETPGRYSVEVTDNLGCTITDALDIIEPGPVTARVDYKNVKCNNEANGSIIVYAEGGSGSYTYELINVDDNSIVSTTNEALNIKGAPYQYKVFDTNGCSWTSNVINLINPEPIVIDPIVSHVTIYGEANGVIDLNLIKSDGTNSGGTPPYTVGWLSGPSIVPDPADPAFNADQPIISNIKAGNNYKVTVSDANNCSVSQTIEVTQPEIIEVDISVIDVRCNNERNGRIELSNIRGGVTNPVGTYDITLESATTPGLSYPISYGVFDNLPADTYNLRIEDANGAVFTKEIIVNQPDEINITTVLVDSKLSVDCFGNATGKIKVNITGGNLPYDYEWRGGALTERNVDNVSGLSAGTYQIVLRDAKGCEPLVTYQENIAGPVGELTITEKITDNKCYGESNAVIDINVTGGTAPYSYLWTGSGLTTVNDEDQYHLYNGYTYTVTVTDSLGCDTVKTYPLEARQELLVSTSKKDVLCKGDQTGEVYAQFSGGSTPYTSEWKNASGTYSSTNDTITNLYADTYIFTIKDAIGCEIVREETIEEPDSLKAAISGSTALCGGVDDGQLYVAVTGGTGPYDYKWYKNYNYADTVGYGAHITNLGAGDYEIFIEDRNKCTAYDKTSIRSSVPMEILIKDTVHVQIYGQETGIIEIEVRGGAPIHEISWTGPSITAPVSSLRIENLKAGYYTVIVKDNVGCVASKVIQIKQPETLSVTPQKTDIKCFGEKGNMLLYVSGGVAPYEYDWTSTNGFAQSGKGLSEAQNLAPGSYNVKITDSSGSFIEYPFVISNPEKVVWILHESKTVLDCYGLNKGNINLEVTGGTRPYSIMWTYPNGTSKDSVYSIGNLGIGTYMAEISDANGCKPDSMFSQTITQPDEIVILDTLTHNNCVNDKDGKIELTVSGGTPAYKFKWSGYDVNENVQDQTDLSQGTYTLLFEDSKGCTLKKEYKIKSNNEISARISGPSNICSGDEFEIQIDVNGLAPWAIEYTDGSQIYSVNTNDSTNIFKHTLTSDTEFKLVRVEDANGCLAKLEGAVFVDVHELPRITIVSAQQDCCLGEPALVDIIFAGKGPWTINYTDGVLDYVDGPFVSGRDYLQIVPKQIGTKTYTIKSVSNENCTVPVDYSVDITAYTYPNLDINIATRICEPNPLQVSLHATGEAPWHIVYYLNGLKYEHDMQQENEMLEIYPNKPDNTLLFESIKSGKRCLSKLNKEMLFQMGLLPLDAQTISGSNMVCRNTNATFSTTPIEHATSYEWSLPHGFNIVSGLGSANIEVHVANDAVNGEVRVWGKNDCGIGEYTAINVEVDKAMPAAGEITIPPYVCDDESIFPLQVTEIENATDYQWVLPKGYNILSGQGSRNVMVQIDKYAISNQVSVVPGNICTQSQPIKANIIIRSLPLAEAGVDIITDCSDEAILNAYDNRNAVETEWRLIEGNASFDNASIHNSGVAQLMYGENILSWTVNDGFCVGYDFVKVTNQNPGITEPEFSELTICEDYMTLRAGKPEFGMGRWTLIAGDGEIENPNSNETQITGLSNKRTNVVRWEVYSPQCRNFINVEIESHDLSSLVDAGTDGVSTTGTYRLSARVVNDSQVTGTWSVVAGDGVIAEPNNPNTVITGLASGVNTIRWTLTGYECEAFDEIKIRMVDEPIASFNMETTEGCVPLTVQFTNTTIGNAEYKWEFGDGSTSDLRSPIHIFERPGTFTVKLTASANGRVDTYTGNVVVHAAPEAAFSVAERQLYIPNAEAYFYNESEEAVQYYWQFGDGGSSDKANPVYKYLESGLYDITYIVTDMNLCSDTLVMEKFINVGKDSYLVFPTAFTPNVERSNGGLYSEGERRLDIFYPIGRNVDTYKLEIYSSWGNKVFESNDQYKGWDGYYLGKCAAQGTYLYKAEGRFKDGNAFQYSGNLVLIR